MKWNRYQSTCPFRKEKIVEHDVEIGRFTLMVSQANQNDKKWHWGVLLKGSYLVQGSSCDSPKEAKEAAVTALRTFLQDNIDLLPHKKG